MVNFPFANPGVPVIVDFDFLPAQAGSPHADKYSTRFRFSTGADVRIQTLFDPTKVRFQAKGSQIEAFLGGNGDAALTGHWVCITQPGPAAALRRAGLVDWIPTGVIYTPITITKTYFDQNLLPLINLQLTDEPDLEARKRGFLTGAMSLRVSADFVFPVLSRAGNQYDQKVVFCAVGGTGMTTFDVERMWWSLNGDSEGLTDIIPTPLFFFYQNLPDSEVDTSHPLNMQRTASNWRALYLRHTAANGGQNLQWLVARSFFETLRIRLAGETFAVPIFGVHFYRPAPGSSGLPVQVGIERDGVALPFSVGTRDGTALSFELAHSLTEAIHFAKGTAMLFVETDLQQVAADAATEYYGIEPSIDNLQPFLDTLSTVHLNLTITHAGAFAKAMGFIARAVLSHIKAGAETTTFGFTHRVPESETYYYTLLIGCVLFIDTPESQFDDEERNEVLEELSRIGIDLAAFTRHPWMNTHGDDEPPPAVSGWKTFGLPPEKVYYGAAGGARKAHFLYNALLVEGLNLYTDVVVMDLADYTTNWGDPDEEIDILYNEKGREFQDWLEDEFDVNGVEEKIIELVVAQSALSVTSHP